MSKEDYIKATAKAVADKQAEAKRVDAELTALKLVARNAVVADYVDPKPKAKAKAEPAPNNED